MKMKDLRINGVQISALEWTLLEYGDVADTNELRDVAALQARQQNASIMKRRRLQMQIDAAQGCTAPTRDVIPSQTAA
jgi:hypothetical protein